MRDGEVKPIKYDSVTPQCCRATIHAFTQFMTKSIHGAANSFLHRQYTRLILNENQHIFLFARHSINIDQ